MKIRNFVLAATIAIVPLSAMAQSINQRQYNQQSRIDQGVRNGELNRREAYRLQRGQQKIQRQEWRAKSDGYYSPGERARIQREQNRQSQRIYNQKHDGQYRHY